jgi:hypothetical protein
MFKVSSDIYFVVYNLYYIGQNDDLGTRAGPIHWDRESKVVGDALKCPPIAKMGSRQK